MNEKKKPADELTRSLLAGLASESAKPDDADAKERERHALVEPEDYLIPPQSPRKTPNRHAGT